ncbi:MAG: hypothetical protein KDE27_25090 [Planctomycetes bacterium]|nr:hypothetical protein [Planctomycetota bacterium]
MRLQSELAAVVVGFVTLNLLLVFAAIGLFARMGPAVELILQRNDATIVAAEDILEALAREPAGVTSPERREAVDAALATIARNVTEQDEPKAIAAIEQSIAAGLEGQAKARETLTDALRALIELNRDAMLAADREAQRLGVAGAWAAAFVGLATLLLGLVLGRRLGRRLVRPVLELRQVLGAARTGDEFRRCGVHDAPIEVEETLDELNRLLDAREVAFAGEESARSGVQ